MVSQKGNAGTSQLSRGAKLVHGHWSWVPATSFLREACSLWTHLSSGRKAFFHSGEAGGESLMDRVDLSDRRYTKDRKSSFQDVDHNESATPTLDI